MWKNHLKTVILLSSMSAILLLFGQLFGGIEGLQFAFVMALIMNGIAYFFSDKIVLRMYKAKKLDPEQYPYIYETVKQLSGTMHLPMPKLWLVHSPIANAFATGRNPKHASVAVTTGLLDILDKDELRGVLAHELSHVKNRDILISTIAATLATAIGYIAHMMRYALFWGGQRSGRNKHGNPFGMIIATILIPIAATILQLALSRSREYMADETGASTTHEPLALASALQKLHANVAHAHLSKNDTAKASTASLFIVHPFASNGWVGLFSTHPPMHQRIKRLQSMARKSF